MSHHNYTTYYLPITYVAWDDERAVTEMLNTELLNTLAMERRVLFKTWEGENKSTKSLPSIIRSQQVIKNGETGTSLAVQWLRRRASTAGGEGLSPGQGTKILHAVQHGQKNKIKFKNGEIIFRNMVVNTKKQLKHLNCLPVGNRN